MTTNDAGKSTPEMPDHTPFTCEIQGGVRGTAFLAEFRVLAGRQVVYQAPSQREAERRAEFLSRSGRNGVRVQKRLTMVVTDPKRVGFYGSVSGYWLSLD